MLQFPASSLIKILAGMNVALLILTSGSAAAARGGYHSQAEALSPRACGFAGGAMADPAETQRCLAERYKAPKPKPSAPPTPSTRAPATQPSP